MGRGHSPLPRPLTQWGGHPLPTLHPLGAFGASILTPHSEILPTLLEATLCMTDEMTATMCHQCLVTSGRVFPKFENNNHLRVNGRSMTKTSSASVGPVIRSIIPRGA